jgi:hypothetical protein
MHNTVQVQRRNRPNNLHRPRAACAADAFVADQMKSKHPMTKRQLIDDIRHHNPTATPRFLAQFDESALAQYLDHLKSAQEKRVRIAGWVRRKTSLRLVS